MKSLAIKLAACALCASVWSATVLAQQTEEATDAPAADTEESAADAVSDTVESAQAAVRDAAEGLLSGDLSTAAAGGQALFLTYGIPAIFALVIIIVAYFTAAFVARVVSAPVRKRVDETLGRFVGRLVFYLIMICAVLGVLQYFGIGVASFAAVLASAGFAIGLAFQGTLSNFSAGIMLLVFRPFKVGDVINAAGITAKVFEIDLFSTIFDTPDNRRIVVPNSSIVGGTIENISHHSQRRVEVAVGVDYGADLEQTRTALTAAADSLNEQLIEGEGRGHQIVLVGLGDSAVNWKVRFWTTADDFWDVNERLIHAVKVKLDEANIGIPYPQLDVHLLKQD